VAASALIAWVAIAILAVPLAADRYMKSSATAAAEGRVVDSINDANRSSDIDPWSPAPHLQLGVIAQSLGLYGKAREEFREAARLEPENWQPPYLTSLLELELGDPEAAMRALDDAAQLNPRSPVIADQRRALERASGRNLDGG
jgi:tetratricopeptide (TPR) repeat protein